MNKELHIKIDINGGLISEKDAISPINGFALFHLPKQSDDIQKEQSSLKISIDISKENIKTNSILTFLVILKKTLNNEIKGSMTPPFLFELLQNGHLKANIAETDQSLNLTITSDGPLEKAVAYFLENLIIKKESNEKNIQKIDFKLKLNTIYENVILKYCENERFDDFFSFLLNNAQIDLKASVNTEISHLLDSLITATIGHETFPFFSFAQECDVKMDLNYTSFADKINYWNLRKTSGDLFFESLNEFIVNTIGYFTNLSKTDLKSWAKFLDLVKNETTNVSLIKFNIEFLNFCTVETKIDLNGVVKLVEFLLYHPPLEDKSLIQKYKEAYLEKNKSH